MGCTSMSSTWPFFGLMQSVQYIQFFQTLLVIMNMASREAILMKYGANNPDKYE